MARRGAHGYVKLKDRARQIGQATGRPGRLTALATVSATQKAKDTADRWRKLVDEVEREAQAAEARPREMAGPPTTIKDYVGSAG